MPPPRIAGNDEGNDEPALAIPVFDSKVKSMTLSADAPCLPQQEYEPGSEPGCWEDTKFKVWMIFEEPDTAKTSLYVNIWVLGLILSSAFVAVIETIPGLHNNTKSVWHGIETFYVMNFTLEFILRLICCPDKAEFARAGMNWLDIFAIAPFYLELALEGVIDLGALRILRLARALRLVKLFRYSAGMQMISHCLAASMDALQLFGILFFLLIAVCASAIYYAERGEYCSRNGVLCGSDFDGDDGLYYRTNPISETSEVSPFQSVPDSVWWCIVTLTTVGYGDVAPVSYGGQIVGFITQMLGVLCLAMPLSIIGANFHEIRQANAKEADAQSEALEQAVDTDEDEPRHNVMDAIDDVVTVAEEAEKMIDVTVVMCQSLDLISQFMQLPDMTDDMGTISSADYSKQILDDSEYKDNSTQQDTSESKAGTEHVVANPLVHPATDNDLSRGSDNGFHMDSKCIPKAHIDTLEKLSQDANLIARSLHMKLGGGHTNDD